MLHVLAVWQSVVKMMEEVDSEDHVGEVTAQVAQTKIVDQLQDAACTDVTQGRLK